jgi:hypothetical protein
MSRTYSQIIELASQILQDSGNSVYSTTELDLYLPQVINEISRSIPNEIKITKTTDGTTRNLTLTSGDKWRLVNLICAEYIVDRYPKNLRNIKRFGNTVELQINALPSADETVYLYAGREHILQKEIGTTDTAGAVKTAGNAGDTSLALKSLGTGTVNEGTTLTITGDSTVYYVISTATIATNEATVSIYPPLSADVDVDTVVTLSLTESTLESSELESIAAEWLAGLAAVNKTNLFNLQINTSITQATNSGTAIGNVAARVTQAIADIQSGRTEGGKSAAIILEANTAIDNVASRITQTLTDLMSGRTEASKITAIITSGSTALSGVSSQITQAIADIASGRTEADKVPDIISSGATSLADIADRIDQAVTDFQAGRVEASKVADIITASAREIALINPQIINAVIDLTSGDSIINTVPVGGGATEFMSQAASRIAVGQGFLTSGQAYLYQAIAEQNVNSSFMELGAKEISAAAAKYQEASGFFQQSLAEENITNSYLSLSRGEINTAQAKIQEANGYFQQAAAENALSSDFQGLGAKELSAGLAFISQAQAYLAQARADENLNITYLQTAAKELQAGQTDISEAVANMRLIASRISIAANGRYMQAWGESKIKEAQNNLRRLAGYKTSQVYSRS